MPGVFCAADLWADGTSRAALRHAIDKGRLVRIRRGVYCDGELWRSSGQSPTRRHAIEVAAAWLALGRRGWATGYSAALLQNLPVPHGQPASVTFALPQRSHGRRAYDGIRLRTASVHSDDVVLACGVPVSGPARAGLEVARDHGFDAGLVIADAALGRGVMSRQELQEAADRTAGWPGNRRMRRVVEFAGNSRESPAESLSYAVFVDAGMVLPECNAWVVGRGLGGVRADFAWRAHRLVGEVDGRVKYTEPVWRPPDEVLVDEKNRQLRIEDAGYAVVRWTGAEAVYKPQVVLDRIARQAAVAAEMFGVAALDVPRRLAR